MREKRKREYKTERKRISVETVRDTGRSRALGICGTVSTGLIFMSQKEKRKCVKKAKKKIKNI